ncbi:ANTAR domain-containing protein [Modestobacter versicolor]|uniref:ANTAR domain-containing protein n=1 Tax=Modestobacter versicolor TaxID=429133 RepID=UPI0034DE32C4
MTVPENTPPAAVVAALEQLARLSLREHTLESVLQTVVDLAERVLPGDLGTSVTLVVDGRPSTPSSSSPLALTLDREQYRRGQGPCLHAAVTGELVEIAETATEQRWAGWCRAAEGHGVGSSLSVPLSISERVAAGLNVYSRETYAFGTRAQSAALQFAPFASVAVANVHAHQDLQAMAGNLQLALGSRAVIDQAKGILIERHRLTADQAFAALTAVSMRTNTKLRDVAERLVRTGVIDLEAPGPG